MPLSLVPESPTLLSACPSPDIRQQEPSGSRHAPVPRFLADPSPSSISALLHESSPEAGSAGSEGKGKGNDLRSRLILRHAVVWAVARGDVELVAWLTSLDGPWVSAEARLVPSSSSSYSEALADGSMVFVR
jgi:hypothetical protein